MVDLFRLQGRQEQQGDSIATDLFAEAAAQTEDVPRGTFTNQQRANLDQLRQEEAALNTQLQALEQTPLEAAAIAAGRGVTTIGRALGLAEPEDAATTEAFEALQEESPIATTVGEIAGESAPFLLPGLGAARVAQGLGAAGRAATAGALGATEAATIARGRGGSLDEQIMAGGLGGAAASALDLVLPRIGRLGGRIFRKVTGRAPDGPLVDAAGNPSQEFLEALDQSGQTFDDVVATATREIQESTLEPREAARRAFLRDQGIEPTTAQVTRNAADFQAQQEAAKTSNAVRDALEQQEAVLTTRFNNAVLETGGQANLPTSSVVDAVTEKATVLDQQISDLYRVAREAAPEDMNIRFESTADTLRKLAPANRRSGGAIEAMVGDLQQKGVLDDNLKVVGRIDVETAEDVRKLANELYDPQNSFANGLLREVKNAIDDDVFRAAGDDVFRQARRAKADFEQELTRAKVSKFDSRKANIVRDVLENKINPDTMANDVVFSKKWRAPDLAQLRDYISTDEAGRQAFDDLRAETLEMIKERSFIGPADEQGFRALSRDKLQKALESIGKPKRAVLFTEQENKFLDDMLEVARLREPVRGTQQGRGPSAQAIGRIERFVNELPILGDVFRGIANDIKAGGVLRAPVRRQIDISPARVAASAAGAAAVVPEDDAT